MRNPKIPALVLCGLLLSAGPIFAGTTGQMVGRVVDEEGSPLPGVSISTSSPSQIGGTQLAETDVSGRFQYPRLAPGYFNVRVELDGFVTQELTEVQVRLDRRTELQVTLPLARFADEVVVTETTPVIDPAQVSTGQTFTFDYLKEAAIGIENRHYVGVLRQAAGVDEGSSAFGVRVLGSSLTDNTYLVDGSDTTDPHDKMTSLMLSFEAIDEIAFHTAGFGAEFGRATGGVVNLVTKSGGNRFSGSFDLRYGDSSFSSGGDHHEPDEEPFETADLNASLGGPIVRDRLWFFTSLQSLSQDRTPSGAPTTLQWKDRKVLGKLTWQAGPNWSLAGRVIANPSTVDNWNSSQFRAPEATSDYEWRGLNGQLKLNGILSDRLLFGARVAGQEMTYDFFPSSGDLTTIAHYNVDTQERYTNFAEQSSDLRERREIETDLTWFVDDVAGSHEIKGGLGYATTGFRLDHCLTGSGRACTAGDEGYLFHDYSDDVGSRLPFRMWVQKAAGQQDFSGSQPSAYLQDAWRPRPDLTLHLGLRWDGSQQENDIGDEIADFSMLQPRFGVAWDIRGHGRDVLRASWGRYMHPSRLYIAEYMAAKSTPEQLWYACSVFGMNDPTLCAESAAAEGFVYRSDPEDWDPAGWVLWRVFYSQPSQTSPDLGPMYADELLLAYEREIYRRTALELSYVKKDSYKIIEDTCNGSFPAPQPDPDCSYAVVANLPGLEKNYEALMLRLESRAYDRFHLIGSYVYSSSQGPQDGGETSPDFDVWPDHFVNRYGYLTDQSRHRVKLNGFVILPLDFSLAINSWWSSEFRWTPQTWLPDLWGTMFLEPRGSRSESGIYQLDLQAGKAFTWGRARLQLLLTLTNLFDSETATSVCQIDTGCGDFEMGEATNWQLPRRYELGLRVEF